MSKQEKDGIVDDVFSVLFKSSIPDEKICKAIPQQVMENCVFLVDTSALGSPEDLLADNCGSWNNDAVRYFYFESTEEPFDSSNSSTSLSDGMEFRKLGKKANESTLNSPWYKICRKYYRNRDSLDFRRVISYLLGKK